MLSKVNRRLNAEWRAVRWLPFGLVVRPLQAFAGLGIRGICAAHYAAIMLVRTARVSHFDAYGVGTGGTKMEMGKS